LLPAKSQQYDWPFLPPCFSFLIVMSLPVKWQTWGRNCFYPCVFIVIQMMTPLNKLEIIIIHKCIC
jgi:hypothetical protein